MLQTLVIANLILYYNVGARASAAYTAIYAGLLSYLLSAAAPMSLVWALQMSVIPLIAIARVSEFIFCLLYGHTQSSVKR